MVGEMVNIYINEGNMRIRIVKHPDGEFTTRHDDGFRVTLIPSEYPRLSTAKPCFVKYPRDVKASEGVVGFTMPDCIIKTMVESR